MNDLTALLAAICTRPEEDTPRLAYADWLDENAGSVPCPKCTPDFETEDGRGLGWLLAGGPGTGQGHFHVGCEACGGGGLLDPDSNGRDGSGTVSDGRRERAEFVRVQCELGRCPLPNHFKGARPSKGRCTCGWCGLRRREGELFPNNCRLWFPSPTGTEWKWSLPGEKWDRNGCVFTRGFVESLTLTAADWLTHADKLAWHPKRTDPCPGCDGGAARVTWADSRAFCALCRNSGRVRRPCPETAHPVRSVTLTDTGPWPPDDVLAYFAAEFIGITFSLSGPAAAPNTAAYPVAPGQVVETGRMVYLNPDGTVGPAAR